MSTQDDLIPPRSKERFLVQFESTREEVDALLRLLACAPSIVSIVDPDSFHLLRIEPAVHSALLLPLPLDGPTVPSLELYQLEMQLAQARQNAWESLTRSVAEADRNAAFEALERARVAYDQALGRLPGREAPEESR